MHHRQNSSKNADRRFGWVYKL